MNSLNTYQAKAQATRSRRTYTRPTAAQRAAYARLVARDGWKHVSAEDAAILATHPWLTVSQREALAASVNWG